MSRRRGLPLGFYRRDTCEVARELLGCVLAVRAEGRHVRRGRIVEVEAYDGPSDRASHAHRGPTPRNRRMFDAGGVAYVYLVYGMHHCLNVVTGRAGYPAAILVRATEPPEEGASASGPGRLTRAFGVDLSWNGERMTGPRLWIEPGERYPDRAVRRTARIGVEYAGSWARRRLRFVVRGHPSVSGPRSLR